MRTGYELSVVLLNLEVFFERWLAAAAALHIKPACHPNLCSSRRIAIDLLRRGEMLTVERMFEVSEYPRDAPAFYSQGYSLTRFLIEHGGEQKLIQFVSDGIDSRDWGSAPCTSITAMRAWRNCKMHGPYGCCPVRR